MLKEALSESSSTKAPRGEGDLLLVLYEHSKVSTLIQSNVPAVGVLEAFGLADHVLRPKQIFKIISQKDKPTNIVSRELYSWFMFPWSQMTACVKPLRKLTIPSVLTEAQSSDEILTVNISDREHLDLKTLIKTLSQIEALYDTVERVHGADSQYPPLEILKIESGADVRIDLKGLGKPIQEIKNMILETWTKHRPKPVDEIVDHNRAVASSIELLEETDRKAKKGGLSNQDGNRFKRAVVSNTLGIFKNGALIEEIPKVEVVDNVKLLDAFGPKLLAAPEEEGPPTQIIPTVSAPSPAGGGERAPARSARKRRTSREVN